MDKKRWPYVFILTLGWLGVALSGCMTAPAQDVALVHLHADTLPRSERIAIRDALKKHGFVVKFRDNHIPFEANTLIFSPSSAFEKQLEQIHRVLDAAGYAPDNLVIRQARNHLYTPGHFGLYLRSEQTSTPSEKIALPEVPFNLPDTEFTSRECESLYTMDFDHDGTVAVAHIEHDTPEVLKWAEAGSEVTLTSGKTTYRYQKTINTNHDGAEITLSIMLTPVEENTGFYGCQYLGRTHAVALNR